jgi:hypothetical protein
LVSPSAPARRRQTVAAGQDEKQARFVALADDRLARLEHQRLDRRFEDLEILRRQAGEQLESAQ